MKPPRFVYFDPSTVAEAVALKAEHGDDAAVLAGGQSLVPLMSMRLANPGALIDVNRVSALAGVSANGSLAIGAGTRQYLLESDASVAASLPILAEAARFIGHDAIRHRGTVGGSLAHADPAAELPMLALVLEAELVAARTAGERTIAAADFFRGFFATALRADEILASVRFPIPAAGTGWGFEEVSRRHGDFALAAAAALVTLGGDGAVERVALVLAGIADRPLRAAAVESALAGSKPTTETIAAAARLASDLVTAVDDIHATRAYRRQLAAVVAERALAAAATRARGR